MARRKHSPLQSLLDAPRVREAAQQLLDAVAEELAERELSPRAYDRAIRELEQLIDFAAGYQVNELVILTICYDFKARLRSYELLAEAFGLVPQHEEATA